MKEIHLSWKQYEDFFDLYKQEKPEAKIIYVIGEKRLCYIGSVGGRGGKKGLARRYDKPYIERAKAIFGSDKPKNQPAFVAHFTEGQRIRPKDILNVEKIIQKSFEVAYPKIDPAFTRRGYISDMKIKNFGNFPSFLPRSITHNNAAQLKHTPKRGTR
jgi:hypothetical protein